MAWGISHARSALRWQIASDSVGQPLDLSAALGELILHALEAAVEVIDPADHGFPLRGKPGDDERHRGPQIRGHDLRAMQAIHAGDESGIALELDLAPSRANSCTCMKRFSKMVSRTSEVPLAVHISAMNCACKSVGKPGKGWVSTDTALSRRRSARP